MNLSKDPRVFRGCSNYSSQTAYRTRSIWTPPKLHSPRAYSFSHHLQGHKISLRRTSSSSLIRSERYAKPSSKVFLPVLAGTLLCLSLWAYQKPTVTLYDAPARNDSLEDLDENNDSRIWSGTILPALDLTTATTKLRTEETSTQFVTKRETSVTRFDSVRVPSNNPSEDEKSYAVAHVGGGEDWKFWGVYDGHAGWATSRLLRNYLTTYVAQSIRQVRGTNRVLSPEAINNAIKTGFLKLDREIMSDGIKALREASPQAEAISRIAPARAGSCALMAIFDPARATLRIACTGDSRAVLGRYTPKPDEPESYTYTAEALSEDQTGFNEHELKRIATDHPNEPDVIEAKSGRLLGMAVTRAFGDHRWKWSLRDIQECQSYYGGTAPRPQYVTPPYMTAEPEITTTHIRKGDFLILASDGLWDHISNEHAVECVSMWMNHQRSSRPKGDEPLTPPLTRSPSPSSEEIGKKKEIRLQLSYWYKATPEHFVVEDKNAATHLVRNALGGGRKELFCGVMSVQAPDSRMVRDDITVQVVFFGDVMGNQDESR